MILQRNNYSKGHQRSHGCVWVTSSQESTHKNKLDNRVCCLRENTTSAFELEGRVCCVAVETTQWPAPGELGIDSIAAVSESQGRSPGESDLGERNLREGTPLGPVCRPCLLWWHPLPWQHLFLRAPSTLRCCVGAVPPACQDRVEESRGTAPQPRDSTSPCERVPLCVVPCTPVFESLLI